MNFSFRTVVVVVSLVLMVVSLVLVVVSLVLVSCMFVVVVGVCVFRRYGFQAKKKGGARSPPEETT